MTIKQNAQQNALQADLKKNNASGEMRRLKAALTLSLVYGFVLLLHLSSWGIGVILALLGVMALHAARLLIPAPKTLPPNLNNSDLPLISLLVAAKNEESVIINLVECLCQIDYDPSRIELWIIDDNSTDHTPMILERLQQKYQQLKVLRRTPEAKGGKSGALNQVLPLTNGEIIGVFDADAQVPVNVLSALIPLFNQPRVGAVQLRKSITNVAANFWTKGQSSEMALDIFFQERRYQVHGIGELRGNGQFVRRAALIDCGGWNEQTITDDLDLTIKLHLDGWDICCLVHPAVSEEGVTSLKQLWHQRNRWAEGGYQRYLDYWHLIPRMGPSKAFDLGIFFLIQYILPTAMIPDLLGAAILHKRPLLSPILAIATFLSTIGMAVGIRKSYRSSLFSTLRQTLLGSVYMLHWIPVMASVTLRMSIRPKKLKWIKTVHQGHDLGADIDVESLDKLGLGELGLDELGLDELKNELDSEFKLGR